MKQIYILCNGQQYTETTEQFHKDVLNIANGYLEHFVLGCTQWTHTVRKDEEDFGVNWDDVDQDDIAKQLAKNFKCTVTIEQITYTSTMPYTEGCSIVIPNKNMYEVLHVTNEVYAKILELQKLTGKQVKLI